MKSLISYIINEDKIVKFDGKTFPRKGWVVIMCGGPGSGKSTALNNQVAIDGKVIDVDKFKDQYILAQKKHVKYSIADGDDYEYDKKNPNDMYNLHMKIKDMKWKEKQRNTFMKGQENELGNVIFDMVGSKEKEVYEAIDLIRDSGLPYKIAIVWVVCNRSVAIYRNMYRGSKGGRMLSDSILHRKHNDVNKNMKNLMSVLKDKVEGLWIISSSYNTIKEDAKKNVHERIANVYNVLEDYSIIDKLDYKLGPEEENPDNPVTYYSQEELLSIDGAESLEEAIQIISKKDNLLRK